DRTAAAFQQGEAMLAAEERAVEIDREHAAPGGIVGVLDRAEQRNAGSIDQAIETPVAALDLGQDIAPIILCGDVERVIDAGASGEIGGDGAAALALDRGRNRGADGAGSTGDEDNLVREAGHESDDGGQTTEDRLSATLESRDGHLSSVVCCPS